MSAPASAQSDFRRDVVIELLTEDGESKRGSVACLEMRAICHGRTMGNCPSVRVGTTRDGRHTYVRLWARVEFPP